MKFRLGTVFASVLFFGFSCMVQAQANIKPAPMPSKYSNIEPIRVVIISMSGRSREAHVGQDVVALPVGQRITLQVRIGHTVRFASNTESHFSSAMTITDADAGRIVTIR
jgi:hypothetical protein